jgi:hypothetical protein
VLAVNVSMNDLALDVPDNFLYALDNVANQVEVFSARPEPTVL